MRSDAEILEGFLGMGLTRKSAHVYLTGLHHIERWFGERDATVDGPVTATLLADYCDTLRNTRSTRQLVRSSLSAYWRLTRYEGPINAVRVPRKPRMRCRALEDEEAGALSAAAAARGDRKGLAVLIGLYQGLRRGEIADLRWHNFDDGWLTIVGKGNITRAIPVHPIVARALDAYRDAAEPNHGDRVFAGAGGGRLNPTTVWLWTQELARDAGLGTCQTHVLRHTALSVALDNTGDLRAVQELAGHARPETTAGYTRVRRQRLEAAVMSIRYEEAS